MTDSELKYKIGISLIENIGPVLAKKLIAYTGSVEAVFNEKKSKLMKIPGIGEIIAQKITGQNVLDKAEAEVDFIKKHRINVLFYIDSDYPQRLKHCNDAPMLLYHKGNADFNRQKVISIVGTRSATEYGRQQCENIIEQLVQRRHNPIIISGLAYGIDICAHRAALKNKLTTIAVLAHGLDTIYPALHRSVAKEIITNGGLVSEFISKTKIDRKYFLQRNRIIAGLSDATLVVESAKKGCALVTADIANSYNRDVFAFPGRNGDKYSEGCNWLIKTHKASLIQSVDDIEYLLNWDMPDSNSNKRTVQKSLFTELTDEEQKIVNTLKQHNELPIDIISQKAGLSMSKVSFNLLNLEFAGLVKTLPGKVYKVSQ